MRIQENDLQDPTAWRFWRGGGEEGFTGKFTNPYAETGGATPAILDAAPAIPGATRTILDSPSAAGDVLGNTIMYVNGRFRASCYPPSVAGDRCRTVAV